MDGEIWVGVTKLLPFPLCDHELIIGDHTSTKEQAKNIKFVVTWHRVAEYCCKSVVIVEGFFLHGAGLVPKEPSQLSDMDIHEGCLNYVFWFNWMSLTGDRFDY